MHKKKKKNWWELLFVQSANLKTDDFLLYMLINIYINIYMDKLNLPWAGDRETYIKKKLKLFSNL